MVLQMSYLFLSVNVEQFAILLIVAFFGFGLLRMRRPVHVRPGYFNGVAEIAIFRAGFAKYPFFFYDFTSVTNGLTASAADYLAAGGAGQVAFVQPHPHLLNTEEHAVGHTLIRCQLLGRFAFHIRCINRCQAARFFSGQHAESLACL